MRSMQLAQRDLPGKTIKNSLIFIQMIPLVRVFVRQIIKESKKFFKLGNISDELQEHLWNQLPSENSMKIAGKLRLCLGMPVMIQNNFATELCITRGQKGYICGWQ